MVASRYKSRRWLAGHSPVCRRRRGDGFFFSGVGEKEEKFKTDTQVKLLLFPLPGILGAWESFFFSLKNMGIFPKCGLRSEQLQQPLYPTHSSSVKLRKNWHQQPCHLALQNNEDAIPFLSLSRIGQGAALAIRLPRYSRPACSNSNIRII